MSMPCISPGTRLRESALRLRPAVAEDAARLTEIALAAKAALGYSPQLIEGWRAELTVDAAMLRSQSIWLAECGDQAAGFLGLILMPAAARLDHLWVAPHWQRRGIGGALLRHAFQLAAAAGATMLETDAEPLAEPFYLRQGFVRTGIVAAPIPGDAGRGRPQMRCVLAARKYSSG